jgi:hypothetical protein
MPNPKLSLFVRAYIEAALWSSTDDNGTPLDQLEAELAPETLARFEADCAKFQEACAAFDLADYSDREIAHDFWLTRNRHGAGFWDGDYPAQIGKALTKLAHSYGECDLYIGDDGRIYA